ncbi:hypothetical protein ACH5RR_025959 [Cinchona calisaya]|uniref:Uncharacterized protein n=1 Tax=Cinchona calisaya TaxID=153742 RepID=A0ABD2Z558_9GENT
MHHHGAGIGHALGKPQSAPPAFSRYGQRRPPTRVYPNLELDALKPQVLSKIVASSSFGEEGPSISRGLDGTSNLLDATFKAVNGNMSGSLGIVGTSHHVVDSTPLSQTIVNALVPQVLNGVFRSKVAHSASNSTGVGIRVTNMNCSNGVSQQRVDGMGSTLNASNMSTLIVDSQEHVIQSAHATYQYSGYATNILLSVTTCPPAYKINCMKSLDEKLRSWKSVLKRTYFKGKSKEEALANVLDRVQPKQWKVPVEYWSLENVQSTADQNKKNRAMHGPSHRTGRTPHAIIRQEMKDKGLETDQLSEYIRRRTDPNGVPKDDEASIGQMREKHSQIPTTEQTSSSKNKLSNNYMTMILNKAEELYEQKYRGKILDMQSQIDALNARLQSERSTVVGTPPMAYTQGGNQVHTFFSPDKPCPNAFYGFKYLFGGFSTGKMCIDIAAFNVID